jgi:NAD(P)-dependent dehydrogenase (short-subunit alcohol dehydrogenase family)
LYTSHRKIKDLLPHKVERIQLTKAEHHFQQAYGVSVKSIQADLSNSEIIPTLIKAAGPVDILINNAGAIPGGSLETIDEATWRDAWNLKVFGYINMTRAFYQLMKDNQKQGVIINITGLSGIRLDADYIAGSSGNACLETFTRTAGGYSMDHGVRILAVSPGAVKTDRIGVDRVDRPHYCGQSL